MFICVDFDGTVVDHQYPHIGEPAPDAFFWLQRIQQRGGRIILFTMRSNRPGGTNLLQEAVEFMEQNNIRLFGVNRNPKQDSWTSSPKAYGDIYVDDAAFGCPLIHPEGFSRPCVNWKIVGPHIENLLLRREQKKKG